MNYFTWIVIGGLVGRLASILMRANAQQGIILNVVVGIVGALLGGFLTRLFDAGTINEKNFSMAGLLVAFLGAIILLVIVNFFRRKFPT